VLHFSAVGTDLICVGCSHHYDSDVQAPVCPHETIEKIDRERKARTEAAEQAATKPGRFAGLAAIFGRDSRSAKNPSAEKA
jgi:hypothetical protein